MKRIRAPSSLNKYSHVKVVFASNLFNENVFESSNRVKTSIFLFISEFLANQQKFWIFLLWLINRSLRILVSQWLRTASNRLVSTEPLARPRARSLALLLAPLTRSLHSALLALASCAPLYSLRSITRFRVCGTEEHSWPLFKVSWVTARFPEILIAVNAEAGVEV